MNQKLTKQVEQVSLEYLVENAEDAFAKTVLSTRTKVILIGGFVDEAGAVKSYMARTKPEIDRRKKLNASDSAYVGLVEEYAAAASEYVKWVRSEDGQPVLREALVSYCTAFENCLKTIAVAFLLADGRADASLNHQVLISSEDLRWARRSISKLWNEAAEGEHSKVRNFFEAAIRKKRCAESYVELANEVPDGDWDCCTAAFDVRNAIVHNLGVMRWTVTLGKLDLHAGWPVELNQPAVESVADALRNILAPFTLHKLGLDGL